MQQKLISILFYKKINLYSTFHSKFMFNMIVTPKLNLSVILISNHLNRKVLINAGSYICKFSDERSVSKVLIFDSNEI